MGCLAAVGAVGCLLCPSWEARTCSFVFLRRGRVVSLDRVALIFLDLARLSGFGVVGLVSRGRFCGCVSGGACFAAESDEVASRSRWKLVNRKTNAALERSALEARRAARAVARDAVRRWLAVGSSMAVFEVVRQQRIENGCATVPSSDPPRFDFLRGLLSGESRRVRRTVVWRRIIGN